MKVVLLPITLDNISMKEKTIDEIQKDFFIEYLKNNNRYYNFIKEMNVQIGDLILFHHNEKVISSAILELIIRYNKQDYNGYNGKYKFKKDTIRIFEPINSDELKKYVKEFKGFNHVQQFIEITNYKEFIDRTNNYLIEDNNDKNYYNELLQRLEIPYEKLNDYKVRLLIKNDIGINPLEIYKKTKSLEEWIAWKYEQDILNRPKVICFVKNYDVGKDIWLYVGTYEVSKKNDFNNLNNCVGYNLKSIGNVKDKGILSIKFKNGAQQLIRNLENIKDEMSISNLSESFLTYNETRVKTKEEWIKVLSNEEQLGNDKIIEILKIVYMSKEHTTTCGIISEYMNIDVAGINSIIVSFGKRILQLLSLPEVKGDDGQNIRWNIPFKTDLEKNKKRAFTWSIRKELIDAIEEKYDWKEKYIIQNYGKHLERYKKYSRKEIHDIFSPNTSFTRGAGVWGISGIIPVPNTISDYIFLVTYGRSQSGYEFAESIDENGILEWQSQPSQTLDEKRIQDFINHNHNRSNIYLFLREKKHIDYSYLGKLAYVSHDNERECPVHFKWQILDWDSNKGRISLKENIEENKNIIEEIKEKSEQIDINEIDSKEFVVNLITTKNIYVKTTRKGKPTSEFNNCSRDFEGNAEKNTKLGNKGEDIVVDYEKKYLNSIGRTDLADQVIATRNFAGNAERFDVLSYEADGAKKYIEVKTTTGGVNNAFHISENEVEFSEIFKEQYYLYRLYNFDKKERKADLKIIKGSLKRETLTPTNYICRIGEIDENI